MTGVAEELDHPVARRRGTRWIIPLGTSACYVLFAVTVHLRLLDNLDVAVRHASGTGEVWGPTQVRAGRFVRALRPAHLILPLLLILAGLSLRRRSFCPFVAAAAIGGPVVTVTLGTKWVMQQADPDIFPVGHGSFPSGHTVAITVAFGLVVLLVRPGTRWGWLVPAMMGGLMGCALILAWVHPATDVIGAGLLAVAALTTASAAGLGQWPCNRGSRSIG